MLAQTEPNEKYVCTVNIQKLNVQNWENAEIQTNGGSDFGMFRFPRFWPLSFLQICSKTDLDWI